MSPRRLILMRHATAATGTGRDFDRPLTPHGLDEAHRVGARLRRQGPVPDRVVSSSARRCVETWQALASGLGPDAPSGRRIDPLPTLYDASPRALLDAIHAVEDAETLLVLAHNPGISVLALELGRRPADAESGLREGFAPASIAVFAVEGEWLALSAAATRLVRFERAPDEDNPDEDADRA